MEQAVDPKERELIKSFLDQAQAVLAARFIVVSIRRSYALGRGIYLNLNSSAEPLSDDERLTLYRLAAKVRRGQDYYVEALIDSEEEGGDALDLTFLRETTAPASKNETVNRGKADFGEPLDISGLNPASDPVKESVKKEPLQAAKASGKKIAKWKSVPWVWVLCTGAAAACIGAGGVALHEQNVLDTLQRTRDALAKSQAENAQLNTELTSKKTKAKQPVSSTGPREHKDYEIGPRLPLIERSK